jgi:hypothetical protein
LSGALVGLFLGLAWTSIVGIAYRQRALLTFSGPIALVIFYGMLSLTLYWQVNDHLEEDLEELQLPMTVVEMRADAWWDRGWRTLPTELTRISARAARDFNLQVAVEPQRLAQALVADGWATDPDADWTWLIRSLDPEPEPAGLPMLAKDFLGRPEVLRLRRQEPVSGRQQVLRLWDSGVRLQPGGRIVYLGQATEQELVRRLRALSYSRSNPAELASLEVLFRNLDSFETRRVGERLLLVKPAIDQADR